MCPLTALEVKSGQGVLDGCQDGQERSLFGGGEPGHQVLLGVVDMVQERTDLVGRAG